MRRWLAGKLRRMADRLEPPYVTIPSVWTTEENSTAQSNLTWVSDGDGLYVYDTETRQYVKVEEE